MENRFSKHFQELHQIGFLNLNCTKKTKQNESITTIDKIFENCDRVDGSTLIGIRDPDFLSSFLKKTSAIQSV